MEFWNFWIIETWLSRKVDFMNRKKKDVPEMLYLDEEEEERKVLAPVFQPPPIFRLESPQAELDQIQHDAQLEGRRLRRQMDFHPVHRFLDDATKDFVVKNSVDNIVKEKEEELEKSRQEKSRQMWAAQFAENCRPKNYGPLVKFSRIPRYCVSDFDDDFPEDTCDHCTSKWRARWCKQVRLAKEQVKRQIEPESPRVIVSPPTELVTDDVIHYRNNPKQLTVGEERVLAGGSKNGINWMCKSSVDYALKTNFQTIAKQKSGNTHSQLEKNVYLAWDFEWTELAARGIVGLRGHIDLHYVNRRSLVPVSEQISVELTQPTGQWVEERIGTEQKIFDAKNGIKSVQFEFHLTPIRCYADDKMRPDGAPVLDVVLVIGQNRMEANRKHLSTFSAFFDRMFNGNFRENSIDEIPLPGVNFEELQHLLKHVERSDDKENNVNDKEVQNLLELSDRLMAPNVIANIEEHLMRGTTIPFARLMLLADRFGMAKILEACFRLISKSSQAKSIFSKRDYSAFTEKTRERLSIIKLCLE